MGPAEEPSLARRTVEAAAARSVTVATAESLTAGLVAAALADVPGSSAVLRGGVVSYHNDVKSGLLAVDPALLATSGSVDAEVARQMAVGARSACGSDLAVSTTGVAGPAAHDGQDVGTVFIGYAGPAGSGAERLDLTGDRQAIRAASRDAALARLLALVRDDT
ncbi:MAG: nicotinamide-nucleotide amidohydrolase family protein [Arthrobacter sp.]|uniref:CinA family protein n=1 Tax=Arthrobacter sp. TaxID=1667 RepID=UPI003498224A